ncbi:MAG: SDR family oxidoreductase [Ardenticatenaceae bacterium]|nr:SDR family oxidoreductase [Ardenticatenaceae bacterium]
MNPAGKVALITGAAHRVGKAIAVELADAGANIVLAYHGATLEAAATQAELEALGVVVVPVAADLHRPAEVEWLAQTALKEFGRVDILVNSAASYRRTPLDTLSLEEWETVLGLNLTAPMWLARTLAPTMRTQPEAVIVNVADLSAQVPEPNLLAHSVAKAGLVALTKALAIDLAPTVRVNAVMPGAVIPPPHFTDKEIERTAQATLLGRWGGGAAVARAVRFLVEDDFATGSVVRVDGGESLAWRRGRPGAPPVRPAKR